MMPLAVARFRSGFHPSALGITAFRQYRSALPRRLLRLARSSGPAPRLRSFRLLTHMIRQPAHAPSMCEHLHVQNQPALAS